LASTRTATAARAPAGSTSTLARYGVATTPEWTCACAVAGAAAAAASAARTVIQRRSTAPSAASGNVRPVRRALAAPGATRRSSMWLGHTFGMTVDASHDDRSAGDGTNVT